MSYLDYSLEIRIDADDYIAGKAPQATAVVSLKNGESVINSLRFAAAPVTNSIDVKKLFWTVFEKFLDVSWKDLPISMYNDGEFVTVRDDSGAHGFPVGSIIRLIGIDNDAPFDDCDDTTWLAEGYTTAFNRIERRWIGENDFMKVSDN